MGLQEQIAAANMRKDRERVKTLGKRFGGLRTREEKVALLCAELRRFEAAAEFSLELLAQWKPVQAALKVMEKEMQG